MVKKALFFSLFFLLLGGVAFAGDYKSKKMPSDKIIIKNIIKAGFKDFQNKDYIGKASFSEVGFYLYIRLFDGTFGYITQRFHLVKLDNNLWLLRDLGGKTRLLQE